MLSPQCEKREFAVREGRGAGGVILRALDVGIAKMINTFVSPPTAWQPPAAIPARPPARRAVSAEETWEDYAFRQDWQDAIVEYLRAHCPGRTLLWKMINSIVAESLPETRPQIRENTRATLGAVMQLVREGKILRRRRRWIAALDLPQQILPLEQIPRDRLRRTCAVI